MGLQSLEGRLERMVEGVFRRAPRSRLRPIEIGRHLIRAIDDQVTSLPDGRRSAPHAFAVHLHPEDDRQLASLRDALVSELAAAVRDYARAEDLVLTGAVSVVVRVDETLKPGKVAIETTSTPTRPQPPSAPDASPAPAALVLATGERITLSDQPVSIGRLTSCSITVADPNASRRHAEVRAQGRGFVVVDLGSTNGTFVNGLAVEGDRPLHHGDVIGVGSTELRFEAP